MIRAWLKIKLPTQQYLLRIHRPPAGPVNIGIVASEFGIDLFLVVACTVSHHGSIVSVPSTAYGKKKKETINRRVARHSRKRR
jgi:hypothetical protein